MKKHLQAGDEVVVNMHSVGMTICSGELIDLPTSPDKPLIVRDKKGSLHYIYEKVTVSYVTPS